MDSMCNIYFNSLLFRSLSDHLLFIIPDILKTVYETCEMCVSFVYMNRGCWLNLVIDFHSLFNVSREKVKFCFICFVFEGVGVNGSCLAWRRLSWAIFWHCDAGWRRNVGDWSSEGSWSTKIFFSFWKIKKKWWKWEIKWKSNELSKFTPNWLKMTSQSKDRDCFFVPFSLRSTKFLLHKYLSARIVI